MTLALLYAQTHPDRISGLILRGTFLARQSDLEWFISNGANKIFADYWEEFIEVIPEVERQDLVAAYHNRVHGNNREEQKQAALAWSTWAGRIVTYILASVNPDTYQPADVETCIHEVKIETHYALNSYFINEDQILKEIGKVPDVPVILIHGRKDLTCTMEASWRLHQALKQSEMVIVKEGGHLAGETPMVDALVSATDKMSSLLA